MDSIISLLVKKLGITNKEAQQLAEGAVNSRHPEEELLDLLGPDSIEQISNIISEEKQKSLANNAGKKHVIINIDVKINELSPEKIERNTTDVYDEYILEALPPEKGGKLVPVERIKKESRHIFNEYKAFNKVQSKVFKSVYETEKNVLVCAPTGAGKTDIALLAIARHLERTENKGASREGSKVVYIAPMKALAGEITRKLSKKISGKVKEYTGDTELTKKEVEESRILVCTPEKFDISTRKISSYLVRAVGLLILDEVHILNDSRGAVIESILCRVQMASGRFQRQIRVLGISATLPNAQDVAEFLQVAKKECYVFSRAYRPVPIRYSVIGTRKAVDISTGDYIKRLDSREKMMYIVRERVEQLVKNKQQVLIFVHTRKETLSVAEEIVDALSIERNELAEPNPVPSTLKEIYREGVFVHHAGLSREVREFAEKEFREKRVKVLVSTSTLAWGVNLPARAVIIFGTSFYSPELGRREDISTLDVQQMFGRAGRPQYDTEAEGVLITDHKSLQKYVKMLRSENSIESMLLTVLPEKMCAEIYLKNIKNIKDATKWFKSTFAWTRMQQAPERYGTVYPELEEAAKEYLYLTFQKLRMLELLNQENKITDLGRIVSHYFISETTLLHWMQLLEKNNEDPIFYLAAAEEFASFPLRESDRKSLGIRDNEVDLEKEMKMKKIIEKYVQRRKFKEDMLKMDLKTILDNADRLLQGLSEYFQYKKRHSISYKALFLKKQLSLSRARHEVLSVTLTLSNKPNALKIDCPFTGSAYLRKSGAVKDITNLYSKKEYLINSIDIIEKIEPIKEYDILNSRIEILPVRHFAENEVWFVDSLFQKIAGFALTYLSPQKIFSSVLPEVEFKKPERIYVEVLPNVPNEELGELMLYTLYEDIVKALEAEKTKIAVIVPYQENEKKYADFLNMQALIEDFPFARSAKFTSFSQAVSVQGSRQALVLICEVGQIYKIAKEKRYFFCGFTRSGALYSESSIKKLSEAKSITIYERPQESRYILQRYA